MNRNVLFGIVLFVIVFMCYVSYSTASDNYQLIRAIKSLTSSVDTLNNRVSALNSTIGHPRTRGTLANEIDDLEDAVTDLERAIRNQ